ncbi:hypothetical protein CH375_01580 [Leptospira ellisii]|nr:hypothetical protein CH375_01580 [Leptospira ellisii]
MPIALLDADGNVRFSNPSFGRRFGKALDSILGKNLEDLLGPGSGFSWNEFKNSKLGKYKILEGFPSEGTAPSFSGNLTLLEGEGEILFELEERSDSEREKRISAVVSRLYHDLQEPIRNLSSFLKLTSDRYSRSMEPKAAEFIRISLQSADRLWTRISGLLRFLRLERRAETFRTVSLENVRDDAFETVGEELKRNGFVVFSEGRFPEVKGDSDLLAELFIQLIHNSIRFRKTSDRSELKIRCEETATFHKISVMDYGIGADLKGDRRVIIFKKYHEIEDDIRPGTGLFFCEKIMELHGGRLEIASEPNAGFTVELFFPKVS